jgi:hypothetical protein
MMKKLVLVAAGLALATPALAEGWHRGHDKHRAQPQRHAQHHFRPAHRPVVIHHAPRVIHRHHYQPVAYSYYPPPPVAYYPPVASFPIASGLSLSFTLPLY